MNEKIGYGARPMVVSLARPGRELDGVVGQNTTHLIYQLVANFGYTKPKRDGWASISVRPMAASGLFNVKTCQMILHRGRRETHQLRYFPGDAFVDKAIPLPDWPNQLEAAISRRMTDLPLR